MTLDDLLSAMQAFPADLPLRFETAAGPVGAGYHVTEIKLARIASIDCGGRTGAWSESVLQLLDGTSRAAMPVSKFRSILAHSLRTVEGLGAPPVLVEFGHDNGSLQIFRPAGPESDGRAVTLRLDPAHAQCKPAEDARNARRAAGSDTVAVSSCCA